MASKNKFLFWFKIACSRDMEGHIILAGGLNWAQTPAVGFCFFKTGTKSISPGEHLDRKVPDFERKDAKLGPIERSNTMNHAIINSLAVDLESLFSLEHVCRPEVCKDSHCCCSYFEIEIHRWERDPLVTMFPAAAAFNGVLSRDDALSDIFEEEIQSNIVIKSNGDDYCILAYQGESGQPLCALHSAALKMNIPPARVKPRCCALWPLVIDDDEAIPILTLHSDAFVFTCNTRRTPFNRELDPGVAEIIESVYGEDFLTKVRRAGRKFLK